MIVDQFRHHGGGQAVRAGLSEVEKTVFLHAGVQWAIGVAAPVRQQAIQPDRIDNHARKNMGAHFRALFHHHNRDVSFVFGCGLADPDRGGQPGQGQRPRSRHRIPSFRVEEAARSFILIRLQREKWGQ
jgi:hypothetical protein